MPQDYLIFYVLIIKLMKSIKAYMIFKCIHKFFTVLRLHIMKYIYSCITDLDGRRSTPKECW